METSATDRFANLFTSDTMPASSNIDQPSLFEREQEVTQTQGSWKVPEVAQVPRHVPGPRSNPGAADDIVTSSDDDDYVSSFNRKPTMQTTQMKAPKRSLPRKSTHSNASSRPTQASGTPLEPCLPNVKSTGMMADDNDGNGNSTDSLPVKDQLGNLLTGHFCPFNLVRRFPYKYMVDSNDRVSRHFFANDKFFQRAWDLHYIHPPESLCKDAVLLLPLFQVQQLIDEIASTFKTELSIPPYPFTLSFFVDGTPQPKLLGTARCRLDINAMQDEIPGPTPGHGEAPPHATAAQDFSFKAFKTKMDRATAATKRKAAAIKKKKAHDRFSMIQDWCKQLRRAQRYLGLRPLREQMPVPDPDMTWEDQQAFIKENEKKAGVVLDPLDITRPTPYLFEKEPIIISIDIESFERNHSLVTEIGISTLDTLDLVDTAPGEGGSEWMKHIRSRHFRIKGREHLVNKDFVTGHPEDFQFGESEFVTVEAAGKAIDDCFVYPFSLDFKHDGRLKDIETGWSGERKIPHEAHEPTGATSSSINALTSKTSTPLVTYGQRGPKQRTILLLGHDLQTDLAYLAKLNSTVFSAPRPIAYPAPAVDPADADNPIHSILEALDTATLYKVLCRESQTRSLTSIMADLGRTAWYAHCGGNDARYTLEALVGLVVKARLQDDKEEALRRAAMRQALEQDTWNPTPAQETEAAVGTIDGACDIPELPGMVTAPSTTHTSTLSPTAAPFVPQLHDCSPKSTSWEAEKARRVATRVKQAQREVEEEFEAWETALSPAPAASRSPDPAIQATQTGPGDCGDPVPFSKILQQTHSAQDKKAAKKSNEEKRREWELRVRNEDGVSGPVDWAVGGNDGCGK